jgi:hypothetical protein
MLCIHANKKTLFRVFKVVLTHEKLKMEFTERFFKKCLQIHCAK